MRTMRIALVHSFYRSSMPSGENQVVEYQAKQLEMSGHSVSIVAEVSDDKEWTLMKRVRTGVQVAFRRGSDPTTQLRHLNPDLVHVHNLFPNFGYQWIRKWQGPIVTTLHNFRPVCANGLLFRAGTFCDLCPSGSAWSSLQHACYDHSRIKTLPLTIRNSGHLTKDPLLEKSNKVVLLSERAKLLYESYGLNSEKCVVIPNSIDSILGKEVPKKVDRAVFVGRLTEEKGIRQLVENWPEDLCLDVVGDGPMRQQLIATRRKNINFLGALKHNELLECLATYSMLVFPSECIEMQPTVVIEALASGVPVLALEGNSGADIVEAGDCGRIFNYSNLTVKINQVLDSRDSLGNNAKAAFERSYVSKAWIESMEKLYLGAIKNQDELLG